jgi:hypothetical protein
MMKSGTSKTQPSLVLAWHGHNLMNMTMTDQLLGFGSMMEQQISIVNNIVNSLLLIIGYVFSTDRIRHLNLQGSVREGVREGTTLLQREKYQ